MDLFGNVSYKTVYTIYNPWFLDVENTWLCLSNFNEQLRSTTYDGARRKHIMIFHSSGLYSTPG